MARSKRRDPKYVNDFRDEGFVIEDRFHHPPPLTPKTENQRLYASSIQHNAITFGLGPAGSGKSYVATSIAVDMLKSGKVRRLILTRPIVEAGENLGFLPGTLEEKIAPYILPIRHILHERIGKVATDNLIRTERISALPLAYMRGHTFEKDVFVLFDEAQNADPRQMKLFLTRVGEGCRIVVNGDISQKDIAGASGLADAVARLSDIRRIGVVEFDTSDIVRSGLCRQIAERYEQ